MYEIKLSNGIIVADVDGWVSAYEVEELFNKIKIAVKEEKCNRIMVDITRITILPDPTAEALIMHLGDVRSNYKLAFIWRDDIFFCSKFERILGYLSRPNILGFNKVKDARNWLMDLELPVLLGSNCSTPDTTSLNENNLE